VSSSPNAPGADPTCRSIAPRGWWFVLRSCPPDDVDPPPRPSRSSPRSRCKSVPYDSPRGCASITNGRSARSGRRWPKPPPGGCADTAPTRSIACCGPLARTTKARPTPEEPLHLGSRERGFAPGVVNPLTFFEPASDGVGRDAQDAGQLTQRGALVIGPEDLFLGSRVVRAAEAGFSAKQRYRTSGSGNAGWHSLCIRGGWYGRYGNVGNRGCRLFRLP
jgi:hypothetical protein